jgi:hypothetical protein
MTYKNIKPTKFKPINKKKYKGDANNIIARSGLEKKYFMYCDRNPNVLEWSSEEKIVNYRSPIDNNPHRYFLDLWVKVKTKSGEIKEAIIEIKPLSKTQPPKPPKNNNTKAKNRYKEEIKEYMVNKSKWEAAEKWAKKKGMTFQILTEKDIG